MENCDDLWQLSDLVRLEEAIAAHSIGCAIVDSLASHSGKADLNSHQDTAQLLVPLRALAEKHHCLNLVIHHLNKLLTTDHIAKVAGSIGITASFRHNLHVVPDPDNPSLRLLVKGKSNLVAPNLPALRFELFPLRLAGESPVTIDEVYSAAQSEPAQGAVSRASKWLSALLKAGSREQQEIRRLAEAEGITYPSLRRAKDSLGVKSRKATFGGAWLWWIPEDEPEIAGQVQ